MEKPQTFEQFLTSESVSRPLDDFVINLILAGVLAFFLSRVYIRYGNSLSNRRHFAGNFLLLTMTTMLMAQLVDEGLMDWDTRVIDILPTFAVADPDVTERMSSVRPLVVTCWFSLRTR